MGSTNGGAKKIYLGVTININHVSKQHKTQEEEKNSYHYHYI